MNWALVLVPLLAFAGLLVLYRLPPKIKRVALIISCIFVIAFIGFSLFLANDLIGLQQSMRSSEKVFLFVSDGVVRTGFWTSGNFDALTDEELAIQQRSYARGEIVATAQKRYFIIDADAFDASKKIMLDGATMTSADIISAIEAQSATAEFSRLTGIPPSLVSSAYSENDLKARLFGYLAQGLLRDQTRIIGQFKEGNVVLLPDSLALRVVRALPDGFVGHTFGLLFVVEEEV